ncbi:MAG: hypothetical protein OER56_00775 [Hyphomicrobiales bacterium]|nr:hypothetical protein [Hyphomicrobiales bacterium]
MYLTRPILAVVALGFAGLAPVMVSAHETGAGDPTDPFAAVTRTHYHPIMNEYRPSAIMERPENWRALNDRAEEIGGPLGQLRGVDEPIRKRKRK